MPRKSYDQFCGLARALDLVGERWTLLIVRNLFLGPRRYSDLLDELPGITTNLLAKRLANMTHEGLISKRSTRPPAASVVYELTEQGAALESAVLALGGWGNRYNFAPKRSDVKNLGWGLFSLKRRYRGGLTGSVALNTEQRRYTLRFSKTALAVRDDDNGAVDATIEGDSATLREAFVGGDLLAQGRLVIEGNRRFVARALNTIAARLPSLR